ncbi:MAG: phage tail protein [Suilimivivens sp.]
MKSEPKYVNYAGAYLKKGQYEGMESYQDCALRGEGSGSFLYIAPVFDSGEEANTWQSLHLDGTFHDCKLEVVAAASELDYRDFLEDTQVGLQEKEELIRSMNGVRKVNTTDLLLTDLQGRYLYLLFKVSGQMECEFCIHMATVEFPKNSFLEYFPEVYQTEDDFFERYISIFQSMYMDVEREIDKLPMRMDYEKAEFSDLMQLAEWIGMDEILVQEAVREGETKKLRKLIGHANEIQSAKGTKKSLKLVLQILYNKDFQILEYFKWYEYLENRPEELTLYQKLYGKDSSCLTILIEEKGGKEYSEAERKSMRKVVSRMIPLGMDCNLIFLHGSSHMDTHCYLDHNSRLASLAAANANGMELYGNVILQ